VGFAMANFLTCAGALHRGAENGGPKHLMLILFSMINLYICDCAKLLKCWEKNVAICCGQWTELYRLNLLEKSWKKQAKQTNNNTSNTKQNKTHTHIYIYIYTYTQINA
jgi:hypothetical protein